jgi:hypothetical protein
MFRTEPAFRHGPQFIQIDTTLAGEPDFRRGVNLDW